ncbi:MAG: hypothetical protein GF364_13245, partial [Candidatus Lokiarchaeota archaeon]|nr:hypothetical protein [Candidatus Lokiarchaeota archaeon]
MQFSDFKHGISQEIDVIKRKPIIKDYFLILGGGKFGKIALDYVRQKRNYLIIVVDKDQDQLERLSLKPITSSEKLYDIIKEHSKRWTQSNSEVVEQNSMGEAYFYQSEVKSLPLFLQYGIPEYIVPVIPVHIAARLFISLLDLPLIHESQKIEIEDINLNSQLHKSIGNEAELCNDVPLSYLEKYIESIPNDLIISKDSDLSVIMLSYAKEGEICPDNCTGPEGYCPHFHREKPVTMVQVAKNLKKGGLKGWIFE